MSTEHQNVRQRARRPAPSREALRRGEIAGDAAEDIEGLLREDQIERLGAQSALAQDLLGKEYELDERVRHDRARMRDFDYRFARRAELDEDDLEDERWNRWFDQVERRDLHQARMVKEWARAGRAVVALIASIVALYAWIHSGLDLHDVWHLLERAIEPHEQSRP